MRAFSYGGGVQSTAALVLAAAHEIDFPTFLFANVGEDSENPATIAYVREIAKPHAARHGIELCELTRKGKYGSLLEQVSRLRSSLPIPVRMDHTGAPGNRSCTQQWKIEVLGRELKRRGATAERRAIVERSACWFCPYHNAHEWLRMRSEHPQLFAQAAELEATLQERRSELGKDPVWLSYRGAVEGATLAELHEHEQLSLEDGGSCDGGYCMT